MTVLMCKACAEGPLVRKQTLCRSCCSAREKARRARAKPAPTEKTIVTTCRLCHVGDCMPRRNVCRSCRSLRERIRRHQMRDHSQYRRRCVRCKFSLLLNSEFPSQSALICKACRGAESKDASLEDLSERVDTFTLKPCMQWRSSSEDKEEEEE